jgi:hypothetical protein
MKKLANMMMLFVLDLALVLVILVHVESDYAATKAKEIELTTGETYTQYDITGDGKCDSIRISLGGRQTDPDVYTVLAIYVNGKRAFRATAGEILYASSSIFVRDDGTNYLEVHARSSNDYPEVGKLLKYESGKLVTAINLEKTQGDGTVKKITGDKITVDYWKCHYTLGSAAFRYTYTLKNGKWKESTDGKLTNVYTMANLDGTTRLKAGENFIAYKDTSLKKSAFTVKKGKNVQILKCRVSGKELYFQIKYGDKTGWIKDEKELFKNAMYVG